MIIYVHWPVCLPIKLRLNFSGSKKVNDLIVNNEGQIIVRLTGKIDSFRNEIAETKDRITKYKHLDKNQLLEMTIKALDQLLDVHASTIVPTQVDKMRAKLANLNHCAVSFLSRTAVNLCWYYYIVMRHKYSALAHSLFLSK